MFLARWIGITALLLGLVVGIEELRLARAQKATAEAKAETAKFKAVIADQNAGVDRLAAAGDRANLDANLAALRVLRDGDARRAVLARSGHGPAELNTWLTETFPP